MNNSKPVKLTKTELTKFIQVLGTYQVKMLYCTNKINLDKDLLDYLINYKKEEK